GGVPARPGARSLLSAREGPSRRVEQPARQAGAGGGAGAGRRPARPGAAHDRDRRPAGSARARRPDRGRDPTAIRPVRRPARPGAAHDRGGLPLPSAGVLAQDASRHPVPAGRGRRHAAALGDPRLGQRRPAAAPTRRPRPQHRPDGPAPATRLPPATRRRPAARLLDSPPAGHRFTRAGSSRHPRPRPRLHPPAAVLRSSADRSAGRPSPGGLNSDRATPAHSDAPHRNARLDPDFEPESGPGRHGSDPEIHHRPLMGRATPDDRSPRASASQGNRPFYTEATGTSMSRSRLFTKLFDSRPYISATDTPGVALAPGTCGFPIAITARWPTERFKEDGMMLKKVNMTPPNYSAPSLQSMQGTTCSFA